MVILLFIKPKDLPEIAHFLGRIYFRAKKYFDELKQNFKEMEKEIGLNEIKNELNRGIAEERIKLENDEDTTVIVDMYGNEHHVKNVKNLRSDLNHEEITEEIKKLNEQNSTSAKPSTENENSLNPDHK